MPATRSGSASSEGHSSRPTRAGEGGGQWREAGGRNVITRTFIVLASLLESRCRYFKRKTRRHYEALPEPVRRVGIERGAMRYGRPIRRSK
jgi:hypothetical protein